MKVLGIIFFVVFIISFLSANVTINERPTENIWERMWVCAAGSFLITIAVGIPVIGILCLIGAF